MRASALELIRSRVTDGFTSIDCPGSWRSLPDGQLGDPVICEVCGREVHATLRPMEMTPDEFAAKQRPSGEEILSLG